MPRIGSLQFEVKLCGCEDLVLDAICAELLTAIEQEGSIKAAAVGLGISYRFACSLVAGMNRCFGEPLVEAASGGSRGGGAVLTKTGRDTLRQYREIEKRIMDYVPRDESLKELTAMLRDPAS